MAFAQEILEIYKCEDREELSDADTKTELEEEDYVDGDQHIKNPRIMWDLYKVARCGKAGHYIPYTRSPALYETLQGGLCDFARYFVRHVKSDTQDWCVLFHAKQQ